MVCKIKVITKFVALVFFVRPAVLEATEIKKDGASSSYVPFCCISSELWPAAPAPVGGPGASTV